MWKDSKTYYLFFFGALNKPISFYIIYQPRLRKEESNWHMAIRIHSWYNSYYLFSSCTLHAVCNINLYLRISFGLDRQSMRSHFECHSETHSHSHTHTHTHSHSHCPFTIIISGVDNPNQRRILCATSINDLYLLYLLLLLFLADVAAAGRCSCCCRCCCLTDLQLVCQLLVWVSNEY